MKHTVIYHSADFDGIFCREIARKFLGETAEYIGWNFGDPKVPMPAEGTVFILDLSPECMCDSPLVDGYIWERIVWIDHHKSSIEKWNPEIQGYRIDGVAACRLAYQWFATEIPFEGVKPTKQQFIDRTVSEPLAVRLAGEYDIWDKRDSRAETFQYGLRAMKDIDFSRLLDGPFNDNYHDEVLLAGSCAQSYAKNVDASICNSLTWLMDWEGLKFLCVNHARFNSLLFAAKDKPETGHDALLGFRFDGKNWMVSLYHANHRKDIDLSVIAVKHGGGGHRGAYGFTCKQLPFSL